MNITKISWNPKEGKIALSWSEPQRGDMSLESKRIAPHPDFTRALQALDPVVRVATMLPQANEPGAEQWLLQRIADSIAA